MPDSQPSGLAWRKSSRSGSGNACVEIAMWRKSSRSGGGGANCVEVADVAAGQILVRDSKLGESSAVLQFTPSQWRDFVSLTKSH